MLTCIAWQRHCAAGLGRCKPERRAAHGLAVGQVGPPGEPIRAGGATCTECARYEDDRGRGKHASGCLACQLPPYGQLLEAPCPSMCTLFSPCLPTVVAGRHRPCRDGCGGRQPQGHCRLQHHPPDSLQPCRQEDRCRGVQRATAVRWASQQAMLHDATCHSMPLPCVYLASHSSPAIAAILLQVTGPDGKPFITCKGAPQIVRDLLDDSAARVAVDRCVRGALLCRRLMALAALLGCCSQAAPCCCNGTGPSPFWPASQSVQSTLRLSPPEYPISFQAGTLTSVRPVACAPWEWPTAPTAAPPGSWWD